MTLAVEAQTEREHTPSARRGSEVLLGVTDAESPLLQAPLLICNSPPGATQVRISVGRLTDTRAVAAAS